MGIRMQTTEEFRKKVYNKFGDKVRILSDYNGGTEPISFIYHCSEHGDIHKSINAKNILAKSFSPCTTCSNNLKSTVSCKNKKDHTYFLKRLKSLCESKGGSLVSPKWKTAKSTYEIDCGITGHPNFFTTADCLFSKSQWCPYCSGRKGNFEEEIIEILRRKNYQLLSKYQKSTLPVSVKCNIDNYEWDITPTNIKKGRGCPVCNLPFSEKVVYDYLKNHDHNFKIQYSFDDLKGENGQPLKFDFVIFKPTGQILSIIEIDDLEHLYNHKSPRRIAARKRDVLKDNYCIGKKIDINRIKYYNKRKEFVDYEWYYKYIETILGSYLSQRREF
ncbi:hypothetical protein J2W97_001176 [Paenibacillus jamilae]|nr:hypothetical protein [Paenibacillus jamilae]